jgi:two-component system LytT family response regulator
MDKYKYLVVEDEPLAQKLILLYLGKYPQFALVQTCKNVMEAYELINKQKIDLIFLDINMPGINGIDLVRMLKNPPKVIFTTAYSEYAATSYDLEAVDYLVKPFTPERFDKSINKFLNNPVSKKETKENEFIFLKVRNELLKVQFADIQYIEARKDYLMVYTQQSSYLTLMTMKSIEELLPSEIFIRVHRSYIVNKRMVTGVSIYRLVLAGKEIPIGEKYKEQALKAFM